mgnify:CR=1 FL=1
MFRKSSNFSLFLETFIDDCYSNQNFDSLVYYDDTIVTNYIDFNLGFGRFYNQGIFCDLYQGEGFGYVFYEGYFGETNPDMSGLIIFPEKEPEGGFCEEAISKDGIYYSSVYEFPTGITFNNDYPVKEEQNPKYRSLEKIKVEIQFEYNILQTLCFVKSNDSWYLLYIDDCDYSA